MNIVTRPEITIIIQIAVSLFCLGPLCVEMAGTLHVTIQYVNSYIHPKSIAFQHVTGVAVAGQCSLS